MDLVRRLIWDSWNIEHIARHDVTTHEVEEVCHGDPFTSATHKGRTRLIGTNQAGRMLTVILDREKQGIYYVVTA